MGGILASPVTDTLKQQNNKRLTTVDRQQYFQALTPQLFRLQQLKASIEQAQISKQQITDEASAIELNGGQVELVQSRRDNIKITQPEDLALAEFYLNKRALC